MKKLIVFFIISNIFSICVVHAQTYYGKGLFGRLSIIKDTTCTINFFYNDLNEIDTCFIRKENDTIFISSKESWRCKVNTYKEDQIKFLENNTVNDVISDIIMVKQYDYSFPDKKYDYVAEYLGIYDSIKKTYMLCRGSLSEGNYIFVYKNIFFYSRVKFVTNSKYGEYIGLELNPACVYNKMLILNEFPLLIKKNRLIPIDKTKQAQCWLDNGFLFPKMKANNKIKKIGVVSRKRIGLMNLPTDFEPNLSQSLQKKYMEYLNK